MHASDYKDETLFREFLTETDEHLEVLDRELLALDTSLASGGIPDSASVENLFRAVHTVKGLAAMFDCTGVRDLAHSLESIFDGVRKDRIPLDGPCVEALFEGADALKAAVAEAHNPAAEGTLAQHAMNRIRTFLGTTESSKPSPSAIEMSDLARARIAEAESEGLRAVTLRLRWGIELRLGSLKRTSLERALGRGEILDIRPRVDDLPRLEDIDLDADDLTVEVIALSDLSDQEIADSLGMVASSIEPIRLETVESARPSAGSEAATPSEVAVPRAGSSEHIVRISIERIDDLMDITGEIVTSRTHLDALVGALRDRNANDSLTRSLAAAVKEMGSQVAQLQEQVIGLRMIPVRQLFSKFTRTVRDLQHRSGKQIRLAMEGESTELDKRVMERIEESLLHMIRNACDHGIESPAERSTAGKPPVGTITLSAHTQGNRVVIEVSDDGAGLDIAAIRERAVTAGLIGPDADMDSRALSDLILRSGFSTAVEVTKVSGRGVGMDVVRQRVSELGGTLLIESEPGAGTTFTLSLPMTLTIVPALLVGEAGYMYALPLAAVSEVLRVTGSDVKRLRGRHVMSLRGDTLPVAALRAGLGTTSSLRFTAERFFVIVVEAEDERLGLAVEELHGQQSVVVKSLERTLGSVDGIGGATILGDGTVIPIIDVDGVIDLALRRLSEDPSNGGGSE